MSGIELSDDEKSVIPVLILDCFLMTFEYRIKDKSSTLSMICFAIGFHIA